MTDTTKQSDTQAAWDRTAQITRLRRIEEAAREVEQKAHYVCTLFAFEEYMAVTIPEICKLRDALAAPEPKAEADQRRKASEHALYLRQRFGDGSSGPTVQHYALTIAEHKRLANIAALLDSLSMPHSDQVAKLADENAKLRKALAGHLFDGESLSLRESIRSGVIVQQAEENARLVVLLEESREAFTRYEMDIDEPPPYYHRRLMQRIDSVLPQPASAEELVPLPAERDKLAEENARLRGLINHGTDILREYLADGSAKESYVKDAIEYLSQPASVEDSTERLSEDREDR